MLLRNAKTYTPKVAKPPTKLRPSRVIKDPKRIGAWPDGLRYRGPKGLWNPLNFCYRRSLLQCLLHLPAFYDYLGKIHPTCHLAEHECTVCALQSLMHKYWERRIPGSFPRGAVETLDNAVFADGQGSTFLDARTNNQGDPHEYFGFLIEQLSNMEHRKATRRLNRLFYLREVQRWHCKDCGANREPPDDAILGYQLTVNQGEDLSLEDRLQGWHAHTVEWTCTLGCNGTGSPKLRQSVHTITQGPEILCIQFNRTQPLLDGRLIKIRDEVVYPEELDLSQSTVSNVPLKYRLCGVVAHRGSAEGGHYVAAVRSRNEDFGIVTLSDDQQIETYDEDLEQGLQRPRYDEQDYDPFLLFYTKI